MASALLACRRILIVEDEFLVAENLATLLRKSGAEVLGPIGWIEEAIAYVAANGTRIDAAVLDLNLHGERTYPVADRLVALDIPFIFATGYSSDAIDAAYRRHPRCEKPLEPAHLVAALIR